VKVTTILKYNVFKLQGLDNFTVTNNTIESTQLLSTLHCHDGIKR